MEICMEIVSLNLFTCKDYKKKPIYENKLCNASLFFKSIRNSGGVNDEKQHKQNIITCFLWKHLDLLCPQEYWYKCYIIQCIYLSSFGGFTNVTEPRVDIVYCPHVFSSLLHERISNKVGS